MINRLIDICMARIYTIVLDVISGNTLDKKSKGEQLFAAVHLVFAILSFWHLIHYRSLFSKALIAFNSPVSLQEPYNHWISALFPSIFRLIYSLILLFFSCFANINRQSLYKLVLSIVCITSMAAGVKYAICMIDNFYLISFFLTILINIAGLLSIIAYMVFI